MKLRSSWTPPGISKIRLKEPFIVRKGMKHGAREVQRQLGGLWVCEIVMDKRLKKALGLKAGEFAITEYVEVHGGV